MPLSDVTAGSSSIHALSPSNQVHWKKRLNFPRVSIILGRRWAGNCGAQPISPAFWPSIEEETPAGERRGTHPQVPGSPKQARAEQELLSASRGAPSLLNIYWEGPTSALGEAPSLKECLPFLPSGINYCALNKPGCEHECINTEEGYYCRCRRGYTLDPNGKTCSRECTRVRGSWEGQVHTQGLGLTSSQSLLKLLGFL